MKNCKKSLFLMLMVAVCFFVSTDKISAADVNQVISCGNIDELPAGLPGFIRGIYNIIKIIIPVAIIILGMLDFAKAVTANETKDMKEYQAKFIRRLISGLLVFFVLAGVQWAFGLVNKSGSESVLGCVECFFVSEDSCGAPRDKGEDPVTKQKKGCDDYSRNDCPTLAQNGDKCKALTETGSGSGTCAMQCQMLDIQGCSERSDCSYNGATRSCSNVSSFINTSTTNTSTTNTNTSTTNTGTNTSTTNTTATASCMKLTNKTSCASNTNCSWVDGSGAGYCKASIAATVKCSSYSVTSGTCQQHSTYCKVVATNCVNK